MKLIVPVLTLCCWLISSCHPQGRAATVPHKLKARPGGAAFPNIGFNDYSGPLGHKVVALTFDDGPDGKADGLNHTAQVLDALDTLGVRASFFVCGNLHTQVSDNAIARADLERMVARGHDVGSHSFTHAHMSALTPAAVAKEFADNLAMAQSVLGPEFAFSLYRLPYGHPYQTNNPDVSWVAPAAAEAGVHVGWGIDTDDWKCAQNGRDGNCILDNLRAQIAAGHSGPILMHSVYQLTVDTLPAVVQLLRDHGYTLVTVEQMVRDKYGASSAEVMNRHRKGHFDAAAIGRAATAACAANQAIVVPY